jgi:hypothetical protein
MYFLNIFSCCPKRGEYDFFFEMGAKMSLNQAMQTTFFISEF